MQQVHDIAAPDGPSGGILTALRAACANAGLGAEITALPLGNFILESSDPKLGESKMARALSSICWRMNCDIVMSRSAGVVITAGGTYERAERPIARQVRARTLRLCKALACGPALRA